MDPERWRAVEALFLRLADAPSDEREATLCAEEARDPELADCVRRMLAGDAGSDDPFEDFRSPSWLARESSPVGRDFGPYRVIDVLGEGGMGVVYLARRTDGLFERDVAIKLIRWERMSENAVRRFESERRALAALTHPNIARLYDGGTTAEGAPWLVMELVEGEPIDRWCDARRLPIDARLRLFATICRGVQAAHRNLIVHCDIKPSNLLVDEQGLPKLLDFGIARLLDEAERGPESEPTARALTPEYASPEQLRGGALTTAIDVWALGVVLYELLVGRRPFETPAGGASSQRWDRLHERAPERPSAVAIAQDETGLAGATQRAALRSSTPAALRRALAGDLDRIVLKALNREPERRYESVQALVEDVERHLAHHPVLARPDTPAYRCAKFVRRNRVAVGAAALVLLAAAAVFGMTLRSELRTRAEALHARIEAESFASIAEFVMDAFLTSAISQDDAQRSLALERVGLQAERVRLQYADSEHLRANLLDALGRVYLHLDALPEAETLIREAQAIRSHAFGERSLEHALSLRSLGGLERARGRVAEAALLFERALELQRTLPVGTHTDVAGAANDLAVMLRGLGELQRARELHEEALRLRRAAAAGSLAVAESLNNLASVHIDLGESDRARVLLEETVAIRRSILTERHPLTAQSLANLALPTWSSGRREEALALLGQAASIQRALHARGSEGLARTLGNLAGMQIVLGRLDAAEPNLHESLALERERLGDDHPALAGPYAKLAELQARRGDAQSARASWSRAIELRRASGSSVALATAWFGYGRFLRSAGALAEARDAFAEAVVCLRGEPEVEALALGRAELALGETLALLADGQGAAQHLREALELLAPYPAARSEREQAEALLERVLEPERR